jgi:peroxiredoxin
MEIQMLIPRKKVPALELPVVTGETFNVAKAAGERGTLVVFYRGLHCPICARYLTELDKLIPEFNKRGLNVIAVSSDNSERANAMADKINADHLNIAYDLSLEKAKEWGLYISASRGKTSLGIEEPELFSEPGLFLVSPDQSLYFGSVNTMPFIRPNFAELVGALDFIIANKYPARGEYVGEL